MPGDDAQSRVAAALRQALADRGRRHRGRGQAGQNVIRQAVGLKRLNLFIQPPENARIAALQAHDPRTGEGMRHQNGIDFDLLGRGAKALFAHIHQTRSGGDQRHDLGTDEAVMDHHLGRLQRLIGAQRQMARGTGTGADEQDRREGLWGGHGGLGVSLGFMG